MKTCYSRAMSNGKFPNTEIIDTPGNLLRWHVDMGADEAVGDEPVDRFALSKEKLAAAGTNRKPVTAAPTTSGFPAAASAPRAPPANASVALPMADDTISDARDLAAKAENLETLAEILSEFKGCPLHKTAKNLVFTDGNPNARIMLIGEAPGADEDRQGKPFVGRSGQLLDKILDAIGLDRHAADAKSSAFISNTIFWRPPGNRKPTAAESEICFPFILRAIELAGPDIIVCLGATPMHRLIGGTEGILRSRGKWREIEIGGRKIPLMPTLHPAYLLRQPAQKRLVWRDFLEIHKKLTSLPDL